MSILGGPDIIDNGLILCLDAANSKSYPSTGTTWGDLTENNNGILINGPIYSNNNKGSIVFDGINDYCDTQLTYGGTNECSYGCWMIAPNNPQRCGLIGFRAQFLYQAPEISQCLLYITGDQDAGTTGNGIVCQDWFGGYLPGGTTFFQSKNRTIYALNTIVCDNKWHQIVVTRSLVSTKLFIDNILIGEKSGDIPNIKADPVFKIGVAGNGSSNNLSGYYFSGNIGSVYFYNRALIDSEVNQNYNALKGRYGL